MKIPKMRSRVQSKWKQEEVVSAALDHEKEKKKSESSQIVECYFLYNIMDFLTSEMKTGSLF